MAVSSPYERWKQMAPVYLERVQNKNSNFHSRPIFALNYAIGSIFGSIGVFIVGSLISNYKWAIIGVSLISTSLCGGHIVIKRFRSRTSKYVYKLESLKFLNTEEGLNSAIEAISPTTRPRELYPKFLVKAGIVSQNNYDRMIAFQARFRGLIQAPAELQSEWAAFQYTLLTDLPHPPKQESRPRRYTV
jgi:hypothetical protein